MDSPNPSAFSQFPISTQRIILDNWFLISLRFSSVPKIFTSIAFDSGGVASGPMTATFLLPLAIGACHEIYSQDIKILSNGFGIVALVAMTPLIVVQLVGLIYKIKLQRAEATKELPYEDVIEFDLNGLNEVDYE